MKRLLCGIAALVGMAALVTGQEGVRVITRPKLPSREVMDRLSLEVAWRTKLKFNGGRDGFFSIQLIPSSSGPELVVQTRAGALMLLDAETGDLKWRTPLEGDVQVLVGSNPRSIFAVRGDQLFVLNRKTGMHRVYSRQEGYPEPIMGYRLPARPSAPLTADGGSLFVAMGQRVTAYTHPDFERVIESVKQERDKKFEAEKTDENMEKPAIQPKKVLAEIEKEIDKSGLPKVESDTGTSVQPVELWNYYTTAAAIQQAPLATLNQVHVVTSDGNFVSMDRFEGRRSFEFKTQGNVSSPMGQYGTIAYVGSDDYSLYALEAERIVWRFIAQGPIYRKPQVTDNDIFLTADGIGMYRLVRETGQRIWRSERADRLLASNPKFVYALDRQGYLLILDALRGTTLAAWDAREWTVALSNEWTDRVYLAAQDGQIIALRHRDLPAPVKSRTFFTLKAEIKGEPKKDEKKEEMEKKDDEKKDDKKDEKKDEKKKEEKKLDKKDDKKDDKKNDKKDAKADPKVGMLGGHERWPAVASWQRRDALAARLGRRLDCAAWPLT